MFSSQNHVMSTHPHPFWCTVCGEGFSQAFQLQVIAHTHCPSFANRPTLYLLQLDLSHPTRWKLCSLVLFCIVFASVSCTIFVLTRVFATLRRSAWNWEIIMEVKITNRSCYYCPRYKNCIATTFHSHCKWFQDRHVATVGAFKGSSPNFLFPENFVLNI